MAAIAAASIGSFLGFGLPLLRKVVSIDFEADLKSISMHMEYIRASFRDHSRSSVDRDAVTEVWLKDIKDLVYDIEDFTDRLVSRFMPQASEGRGGLFRGGWRSILIRIHIGGKIGDFKKRSAEARKNLDTYQLKGTSAPTTTHKALDEVHPHVSMEDSLLQLVTNAPRGSQTKPKVISIISYNAVGSSFLVNQVCTTEVRSQFDIYARVDAKDMYVEDVLHDLHKQLIEYQNGVIGTSKDTFDVKASSIIKQEETCGTSSTIDVKANGVSKPKETGSTSSTDDVQGKGAVQPEETGGTSSTIDVKAKGAIHPEETGGTSSISDVKAKNGTHPEETSGTSSTIDVKSKGAIQPEDTGTTCSTIDVKDNDIIQPEELSCKSSTIDDVKANGVIQSEETGGTSNGVSRRKHIKSCLKDVRFLMVIDNVNMKNLNCIVAHLGDDVDGVIIATTDYTEAIHCNCPPFPLNCSGTPHYLMMQELKEEKYEEETEKHKKALRDLLVSKYNKSLLNSQYKKSLSSLNLEQCLLYFCIFPNNHLVRWNLLKMRYLAEGIVLENCAPGPGDSLKTFIDQQGIQPIQVRKNGQVKRCQLPVMLLNHISGESKSKGFLTLSCGCTDIDGLDEDKKSRVRRLSLHPAKNGKLRFPNASNLCRLRTLVVFDPESIAANINELSKYKLLRVLDMKECDFIRTENDLKKICDLMLLRCLSLGNSIDRVPRDIAKLQLLQTLDMTKTKTVYVPVEVMELPELQHLIGKFQLYEGDITNKKYKQLSSTTSKLERLSGFVISNSKEFRQLVSRMKKLKKVKLWYDAENWTDDVLFAIKNFIDNGDSLSIECTKCPKELVESLKYHCKSESCMTSLKLRGDLRTFLDFQGRQLMGIQELCFSGTNLRGREIVRVVNLFKALTSLKLVEDNLGPLTIPADCLYGLKRLCLVGVHTLREIKFQSGALVCLETLHMFFGRQENLSDIDISCLSSLREIGLHSVVNQDIKHYWQARASEHKKKPKVVLIQSPEIEKNASNVSDE